MKIIQTFLSAGHYDNRSEDTWWTEEKYRCFSFALSCLQLVKYYPDVTLITDKKGKELLIDAFHLPYHNVRVALDDAGIDAACITDGLAKVFSWSLPLEPFCYVDETVFLWEPLSPQVLQHGFFAFNSELDNDLVLKGIFALRNFFGDIPSELFMQGQPKVSLSTRIVGGKVSLYKEYYAFVMDFINRHRRADFDARMFRRGEVDPILLNYFIAQFSHAVPRRDVIDFAIDDRHFTPFTVFEPIQPACRLSYIPEGLKSDFNTQSNLSFILKSLYPEVHQKINRYFRDREDQKERTNISQRYAGVPEKDFFVRTQKALELISSTTADRNQTVNFSVKHTEVLLHHLPDSDEKKLAQDAFDFEKAKYAFHLDVTNGLSADYQRRSEDYRQLFFENVIDVEQVRFVRQASTRVVESLWKWGIYTNIEALYPLRVVYNYALPAGYFQTLLWFSQDMNMVAEYDLQQFDMILLDAFQNPATFENAFRDMGQYFEEGPGELEVLKPFALSRLKELLLMGAIGLAR